MSSAELREAVPQALTLGGWPVLLARDPGGEPRAVLNRCSHAASAFLPAGRVRRGILMCPAHGARFSIEDGACIGGLYRPLRTFACREVGGWIEIAIPEHPPAPDEQPVAR